MKPPICCICNNRIKSDDEGDLIFFKETEQVKKWKIRMERENKIGHPINAEWFCNEHLDKARELSDLQIREAIRKIKEFYKDIR